MNVYSLIFIFLLGCGTTSENEVGRVPNTVPSVGVLSEKGLDKIEEHDFFLEKAYKFPPEIFPKEKFDVISSESFSKLNPIEIREVAAVSEL